MAVAVAELLLGSVAVSVTVFAPKSSQSNDVTSNDNDTLQLSLDPLSMSAAVIVAAPLASRVTVISCAIVIGSISSTTVTVAVSLAWLPFSSWTNNVIVLDPKSSQSKVEALKNLNAIPQLSLDPLSISETVMDAAPLESRLTVISCVTTVGSVVSWTVIVWSYVDELPVSSVAVHVLVITELLPVPLTVESEYVIVTSLSQLSVAVADPPVFAVLVVSTSHSTIISAGTELNSGSILSTTVTVCVAVAVLPEPSVTVHVTVVSPSG